MRAFLDPGWKREFGYPREHEPLPKTASPFGASSKERQSISQLLADPSQAKTAAAVLRRRRERRDASPSKRDLHEANRELWTASVKDWLRQHDRGADWELPKADEKVLFEWFEAIDIDRSGTVDASEISALLAANRSGCSPARIEALFRIAGKQPHDELGLHDFVKLMHLGGAATLFAREYQPGDEVDDDPYGYLGTPAVGGADDEGVQSSTLSESRSSGDLAVLAYRRQRVLNDLRDPTKRAPFATHDAFLRKYAPGARKEYLKQWKANATAEGASSLPRVPLAFDWPSTGLPLAIQAYCTLPCPSIDLARSSRALAGESSLPRELTDTEQRRAAEGRFLQLQLREHDRAAAAEESAAAAAAEAAAARPVRATLPSVSTRKPGQGWLSKSQKEVVHMQANIRLAGDARREAKRLGLVLAAEDAGMQKEALLLNNKLGNLKSSVSLPAI